MGQSVTDALVPDPPPPPTLAPDLTNPTSAFNPSRRTHKILKKIPHASCHLAASKLATILDKVVKNNSATSWDRLIHFPVCCLCAPRRGGHRRSLPSFTNELIGEEDDPDLAPNHQPRRPPQQHWRLWQPQYQPS